MNQFSVLYIYSIPSIEMFLHQLHKTNLTLSLFIEVPVPSQESERSCICVSGVSILPLSTTLVLDFGAVPIVCYFWFFILLPKYTIL